MRTFLRAIATVQVWVAAVGMVGVVGLYLYRWSLSAAWPRADLVALVVVAALLLTFVGGALWCLANLTHVPRPVFAHPGWGPMRWGLRALAGLQIGIGVALALAAAESGYDHLKLGRKHGSDAALWSMTLVPVALGLACVGGVLWCLVPPTRPADPPPDALPPERRPVPPAVLAAATLAVKLVTLTVIAAGVLVVAAAGAGSLSVPNAVAFMVFVLVGGILWCSNRIALTPAAPVTPGSPLVRHGLRVLAAAQVALALWMGFAAGANLVPFLADVGWPRSDAALRALALLSGAVGLACLGGVLWCVARVAYPHPPQVEAVPASAEPTVPAPEAPPETLPEPRRGPLLPVPVRPMRTYLRTLAASLVGTSVVLAIGSAGAAGYYHGAVGRHATSAWTAVAPVFALLAVVGLFLFHLAGVLLPAQPGKRRVVHPARQILRVVAAVQMGVGGLVVAAAVLVAGDRLLLGSWRDAEAGLVALGVGFAAGVVTCLGGLLWCAVRLAYPEGWDDE